MKRLDEFNRFSEGTSYNRISVGKSSSVVDVVKEINQVLNEDREEFYRVPLDRGLIAQELLLFENGGTDDLENLVNTPFSKARVTLKTTWVDANQYTGLLLKLERKIEELFGQEKSYVVTGLIPIMVKTITFLMEGMLISYLIAGVVITLLMIFLLADFRLGLWSMIPNFLPILTRVGCDGNARSALGRNVDSCRQHSDWTCCRRYRALHAQLPSESTHSSGCTGGCGKNTNFNWTGYASYHYRSFRRFFHLHYFVYEQPYFFWSDYRFDHYHRVVWRYPACPSNDGFDLQKSAFQLNKKGDTMMFIKIISNTISITIFSILIFWNHYSS